jgi:hypothetical protein
VKGRKPVSKLPVNVIVMAADPGGGCMSVLKKLKSPALKA